MKIENYILLLVTFLSLISCSSRDKESDAASMTAQAFLEAFYTCDFGKATALCTSAGVREVSWFASNLSEEELALIVNRPKIKIGETVQQDTVGVATFSAYEVLVASSLEEPGRIGSTSGRVLLVKRKDKWMVDGLEWQTDGKMPTAVTSKTRMHNREMPM